MRSRLIAVVTMAAAMFVAATPQAPAANITATYGASALSFTNTLAANVTNTAQSGVIDMRVQRTISLSFRGSLAQAGNGAIVVKAKPSVDGTLWDNNPAFIWTIDTSAWTAGSTNCSTTNAIVEGYGLKFDTIGNGNTSAVSAVQIKYGEKTRIYGNELN